MPRIPIRIELMRPFKGKSGVKAQFHAEVSRRCDPDQAHEKAIEAANELADKYFTDIKNDLFRIRKFLNWADKNVVQHQSPQFQERFLEILAAMNRIEDFSSYSYADIVLGESVTNQTDES